VHDLASRRGLDDDTLELAVRRAIEKGWLIGQGEPPHSVCLASGLVAQMQVEPDQEPPVKN